ncbi:hypothetical protein FisN_5Lh123 [Fistulifera solaris]|uniref:Uncharacterized protein n=1 Tax=Fistulifera solaris TaxID=1519565 RepID=A0A1Z5JIZ2_FISSO|nr:hypothetical protein FisN_5Lh123 [Fistulifera solaris]|eukprot:GAX13969.1 hypothetical protein FisN_5Lh123 [Fistulifera solaris]
MALSNGQGMPMMAGIPQDGSMGMASFANNNNRLQTQHLGPIIQGQTIQNLQTSPFSSNHSAPLQRGVISHMSMPYGGLSSMVQQLHQDQHQQQQQIRHQPLQHEQIGSMDHHLQLQAPLMRSVIRHNSAPPLGMMQNVTASMGNINLLGNQMQQQPSTSFQSNFLDLQNNHTNPGQPLNNFVSSGRSIPDPGPVSQLPPPRRVPVKGLGGTGGMRSQLKREASDNSIGFEGILNGQNQLSSIMDLSMSENMDDDIVAPMRVQERKLNGLKPGFGGGIDMDMSTATLDRMSDFGESTTRFSESTNNISFSNVFEESDKDYAFQR